jgi:GntR family transcriptional regulator
MPLKLTAHTLDRVHPHPPHPEQLADQIPQAIATEDLRPGDELASEQEIADTVGIDKATARRAIDVLAAEGLLVKRNGRRTTVAQPPPVRVLNTQRYRDTLTRLWSGIREDTAAFVTDHGAAWGDYTIDDPDYSEETATPEDQRRLGIKAGSKVMRRRMVKQLHGEPIQIQRSAVPLKLAKGTVLAEAKAQPYPDGTLGELFDAGLLPAGSLFNVAEEAHGRMPNTTERRLLRMEVPAPVWDIVRVIKVDGVPVEVSRVIAPMARIVLAYETDFS